MKLFIVQEEDYESTHPEAIFETLHEAEAHLHKKYKDMLDDGLSIDFICEYKSYLILEWQKDISGNYVLISEQQYRYKVNNDGV